MTDAEHVRQRRSGSPALFGLPRLATAYLNAALVTLGLPPVVLQAMGDAGKGG
jgi:hypothetical protein